MSPTLLLREVSVPRTLFLRRVRRRHPAVPASLATLARRLARRHPPERLVVEVTPVMAAGLVPTQALAPAITPEVVHRETTLVVDLEIVMEVQGEETPGRMEETLDITELHQDLTADKLLAMTPVQLQIIM